jgi:uncharacterized Zn-finger protein
MTDFEVIKTKNKEISCDGGKGSLGHPKVFLTFKPSSNEIVCPYCSRKYILEK